MIKNLKMSAICSIHKRYKISDTRYIYAVLTGKNIFGEIVMSDHPEYYMYDNSTVSKLKIKQHYSLNDGGTQYIYFGGKIGTLIIPHDESSWPCDEILRLDKTPLTEVSSTPYDALIIREYSTVPEWIPQSLQK